MAATAFCQAIAAAMSPPPGVYAVFVLLFVVVGYHFSPLRELVSDARVQAERERAADEGGERCGSESGSASRRAFRKRSAGHCLRLVATRSRTGHDLHPPRPWLLQAHGLALRRGVDARASDERSVIGGGPTTRRSLCPRRRRTRGGRGRRPGVSGARPAPPRRPPPGRPASPSRRTRRS
jgi:hypothetical protein